jgi:hypothetical protein
MHTESKAVQGVHSWAAPFRLLDTLSLCRFLAYILGIIIPMGIITIMGTIIIHVMLAGQAFIMGFIAALGAFIGIIAMQFIPAGHAAIIGRCIIFPDVIISPAMGSIAAIATIPINARSIADVILLDVVIYYPPNRVIQFFERQLTNLRWANYSLVE